MIEDSNELVKSFVEDCREHLDSIESALMDIEAAGDDQNPELVNSVFRLAHSIKGGAGMLGLDNIKTLAHKLENVLHMVRSNELVPTHAVVEVLLKGFDRLTALVDNIAESERMPIDSWVDKLLAISTPGGGEEAKALAPAQFEVGKTGIFSVDAVSLEQAKSGGNDLYLLEFDLIHDIHGKGRMPFEVLKMLTDTGRIVDCKVDLDAVGDLDAFGNSIPFYVLFATILEPKYVSGLVKLPDERVRRLDDIPHAVTVAPPKSFEERFGGLTLRVEDEAGTLALPQVMAEAELVSLRSAFLAALDRCASLALDWSKVSRADVFFLQMVLSARKSFAACSKPLCVLGPLPDDLRVTCLIQGLGDAEDPGCLLPVA
jgi:HPt (histidine-containing phosphotransfer) domain-containing protein